jgi:hypothetical protein
LTQNNDTLYYNRLDGSRLTHPALMGDPTLRMFPVRPASNLTLGSSDGKTEINISHLSRGVYNACILSEAKVVENSKIVKQ